MASSSFTSRVSLLPMRGETRLRRRNMTYPLANSSRKKDRRWPLVLRFWKGSIHGTIALPVLVHALVAAFVVYVNQHITRNLSLPSSIIPSLSIVVGLMLVFRNQTAFQRFWDGRCHLAAITTAVRCISRELLVLVPAPEPKLMSSLSSLRYVSSRDFLLGRASAPPSGTQTPVHQEPHSPGEEADEMFASTPRAADAPPLSAEDEAKTLETIRILIAVLYTVKNHLRAEWGMALSPGTSLTEDGQQATTEEYKDLLPPRMKGYEHRGLGLTLQLVTYVEEFVRMGVRRDWFHNSASSQILAQLNTIVSAYGSMEVIRLTPIPVAHLIHHKQTLALFCSILPFAMAYEMGWWAVPLTAFVAFTLYGIEGIAQTYEDPFGRAKIDISMDDIVEDARREVEVMLAAWQTQGPGFGCIFVEKEPPIFTLNADLQAELDKRAQGPPITLGPPRPKSKSDQNQVRFVIDPADAPSGASDSDLLMDLNGGSSKDAPKDNGTEPATNQISSTDHHPSIHQPQLRPTQRPRQGSVAAGDGFLVVEGGGISSSSSSSEGGSDSDAQRRRRQRRRRRRSAGGEGEGNRVLGVVGSLRRSRASPGLIVANEFMSVDEARRQQRGRYE